jgi:hypothetical protein
MFIVQHLRVRQFCANAREALGFGKLHAELQALSSIKSNAYFKIYIQKAPQP